MTIPIEITVDQKPARTSPVTPFEGMSDKALEALDDMTRGVSTALDDLKADTKKVDLENSGKSKEEILAESLDAQVNKSVKALHTLGHVSDQLARFSVAMGIAQSFGRNMQSFLRGQ